jgi:hypothetical protein
MGGLGSGNYLHFHRPRKRRTVEKTLVLSIDALRKSDEWKHGSGITMWTLWNNAQSSLAWRVSYANDEAAMTLMYAANGETIHERIPLEQRPQKLGGMRFFFRCPACGARTLKLYGLCRFLCRACQNLTYASCQESGNGMQRMFVERGFVQFFQKLFDGVTITPNTAQKLVMEHSQSKQEGKTWKKLRKKMKAQRKR